MKPPFQISGPITEQRATAATEWMIDNAIRMAKARAHMNWCNDQKKVTLHLVMKFSDETTQGKRETEAYASSQYAQALQNLRDATEDYEKLAATSRAAQHVIEVWRSLNSNLRKTGV